MFISRLAIRGYKNTYNESVITLNKGLNILLGENGCGKTAVINALRLLLREPDSYYSFSTDDFYCSLDRSVLSKEIEIDADLVDLSEDEKLVFLSWCDADFNAQLHLQISENTAKPGSVKRKFWGGQSSASIFEEDTFDRIECIYLPPLRDAESKLSAGRRSRLATLLKKQYGDDTERLVTSVADFNNSITQNCDGHYAEIATVKETINKKIVEALGEHLGQSINLQFSEASFNKIIENIRMVFFPRSGETDVEKFRDLATNSLGYNNLLYIATVFSELELIKDSDVFTILLIEEPEAHLHPQLQIRFIKYLESLSATLPNAQIVVSTHSPVLASSVSIDKLIHLSGTVEEIISATLSKKKFSDPSTEKYINRWLDATKSAMLFSKGILMVEGIAESLALPRMAQIVLQQYNSEHEGDHKLGLSLDEMGISVVNINGINFKYFMKLFGNFENSSGPNIPIFCAGITDRDPDRKMFPQKGDTPVSKNPVLALTDEINQNDFTKVFMSPLKTFEYDLAIDNIVCMADVLKQLWPTRTGDVCAKLDSIIANNNAYITPNDLVEDAKFIYNHIEDSSVGKGIFAHTLAENISDSFVVPQYIRDAILWACGGIKYE